MRAAYRARAPHHPRATVPATHHASTAARRVAFGDEHLPPRQSPCASPLNSSRIARHRPVPPGGTIAAIVKRSPSRSPESRPLSVYQVARPAACDSCVAVLIPRPCKHQRVVTQLVYGCGGGANRNEANARATGARRPLRSRQPRSVRTCFQRSRGFISRHYASPHRSAVVSRSAIRFA